MRTLVRFPIIHGNEDMGKLDGAVSKTRTEEDAQKHQEVVKYFWKTIEEAIKSFGLDFSSTILSRHSMSTRPGISPLPEFLPLRLLYFLPAWRKYL